MPKHPVRAAAGRFRNDKSASDRLARIPPAGRRGGGGEKETAKQSCGTLAPLRVAIVAPNNMMTREIGDPACPLWLLGDSNPTAWEDKLESPLDPRHPARHSIVTPILDGVQDGLYRACGRRIETRGLYIRNAVTAADSKPGGAEELWDEGVYGQVVELRNLLEAKTPPIVLTFGAFSFEFARRAIGLEPAWRYGHWGTDELGKAFRAAIKQFDPDRINVFPLLHITIARGRFLQAHEYFTRIKGGNYFEFVSHQLADRLRAHWDSPRLERLWIAKKERAAIA